MVRVGWGREEGFDGLAREGDRVRGLEVQAAGKGVEDLWGDVGPFVSGIASAVCMDRRRFGR